MLPCDVPLFISIVCARVSVLSKPCSLRVILIRAKWHVCGCTKVGVELTTPEGHTYRAGRLAPEERLQKILKYRQKRHERNFTKRIKYQCRKTLADSRPRVRGRFARNDDSSAVMPSEGRKRVC